MIESLTWDADQAKTFGKMDDKSVRDEEHEAISQDSGVRPTLKMILTQRSSAP